MSKHYVDGKRLTREMNSYFESKEKAKRLGLEEPEPSDYIGRCVMEISRRRVYSRQYFNVPSQQKEDMVGEACFYAMRAIYRNYNPEKLGPSGSAFSFISTAVYFGLLEIIGNFYRHLNTKNDYTKLFMHGQSDMSLVDSKDQVLHNTSLTELRTIFDDFETHNEKEKQLDYAKAYDIKKKEENERKKNSSSEQS